MLEENQTQQEHIHFGHLGLILSVAVLLIGVSWMKNPNLFSVFKSKSSNSSISADLPRYYAYEPSAELSQPLVAGASTEGQGPMIINEDGSLSPAVEAGDVLGASLGQVELSLEQIAVREIADSDSAIKQYLESASAVENDYINNSDFEAALTSGSQALIDSQAQKLLDIKNNLQKLSVPDSLVRLQKLKIAQYSAAVNLLNNFTEADNNPELVGQYLGQFLKSQQELDIENEAISQKYNLGTALPDNAQ